MKILLINTKKDTLSSIYTNEKTQIFEITYNQGADTVDIHIEDKEEPHSEDVS